MRRFKLVEKEEKPKLTHQEEILKMFDKRMNDVNQILQYHQNGLEANLISLKVRLAESYIQDVVRDGFEKTKIQLLEQYRLNGGEMMTERDAYGKFVKKVEEIPKTEMEPKRLEPVTSKDKKSITDYIKEVGIELKTFTLDDMVEALKTRNLPYTKGRISTTLKVLDVDNVKHLKLAFLKKDADNKYTIV